MARVTREVTRENELRAWELRQKCWTQERIAAELGVDQGTVSKMLSRMNRRYLKTIQTQIEERKAEQTGQLEKIAESAFTSFESDPGNARLLQAGMQALSDIRKILGMDAPTRNEHTGKDGGPIEIDEVALTDEQRASKLLNLLERAKQRAEMASES